MKPGVVSGLVCLAAFVACSLMGYAGEAGNNDNPQNGRIPAKVTRRGQPIFSTVPPLPANRRPPMQEGGNARDIAPMISPAPSVYPYPVPLPSDYDVPTTTFETRLYDSGQYASDMSGCDVGNGVGNGGGNAVGVTVRQQPPAPVVVVAAAPVAAPPPEVDPRRWLVKPVRYNAREQPLAKVLREFAAGQGVASQVSPKLDGVVTGTFSYDDPGAFLDALAAAQGFNWYFDGGVAHFFADGELESRLIPLEGKSESSLREILCDLGLFDPRFVWRPADGGRLLMVQGPPVYLERVTTVLGLQGAPEPVPDPKDDPARNQRRLGVFRLKHAWAAERSITTGNTETTVPGVADLLRQILSGDTSTPASSAASSFLPAGTPRTLKGTGVVGRKREGDGDKAAEEGGDGVPFIQADSRLNAVLVWDTDENLEQYKAIIETLDQALELVEIRAAIIDVEADRSRELGVSWEYTRKGGSWQHDAGSNVGDGDKRVTFDSIAGDGFQYATIFTKGLDNFMARVSALAKQGSANVLSRPTVLTQDNIQATLEHTETFYVKLEGENEVDLADITTGLILRVTPHVVMEDDGSFAIQLAVYIVNGSNSYDATQNVEQLPRVKQSTITTQAVVYEGEALVIGGYYTETRQTSETGVPVLRKIPGLGVLFRNRSTGGVKSERLFVLSPRLVRPGESPMVKDTEAERSMMESPARKMLDGPALKDPAPPDRKQQKKQYRKRDKRNRNTP